MGWNISHGTNHHGEMRRSYTSMSQLAQQLAHVLPAADWRAIKPLFPRSGDPFTIPPAKAAEAARIIRCAAAHRLMPAAWAEDARELAGCAEKAAGSGQGWRWS